MIDHITVHVTDLDRAVAFYAKALAPLGYEVIMKFPGFAGLGVGGKPDLWLGAGASVQPTHVAIRASTRKLVDAFYEAAMAAGGKDNGKPGVREMYHPNYYGAFVHCPDGHNLEAVCHEAYLG
jgi:catechol 2,3-dioxygenase-like lactoylglutathione lyase family enzyme